MPKFSQADLLTYAANRQRPDALGTLLSSAQAPVATEGVEAPVTKVKAAPRKKSTGSAKDIYELFYDPQGAFKFGARLPNSIGGHSDHVHVAADRKRVIYIGRQAQKMGLRVSEQSAFSGSRPTGGHAANSYHYKDEGIDVSGSTDKMAAFARWVRRTYNLGK